MKKSYVVNILVVLGLSIVGIIVAEGSPMIFWDFPSFVFTPLFAVILLLGHYSPIEIIDAFKCSGKKTASEAELKKSLLFFSTLHKLIIISGFFAFMLAFVLIISLSPSEEFNKSFGKFMAIGVLTIVYALFIIMTITVPYQSAIKKKLIG